MPKEQPGRSGLTSIPNPAYLHSSSESDSDTSVNTQTSLKKKKAKHTNKDKQLYKCKNCHLSFLTLNGLLIHTKTCEEDSSDQNSSSESESGYPTSTEENVSEDDDGHSKEGILCQYCNRTYKSKKGIAVHRRACNAESFERQREKRWDKSNLVGPMIESNKEADKKFRMNCPYCSRVFTSKVGLAVHRRYCYSSTKHAKTHTSKNEGEEIGNSNIGIKCQYCEGTFKSRKGIAVHRRVCNSTSSKGKQPGRSTLHERRSNFSESRIKLLLAAHINRNEIIKCHFCGRKFYGRKGISVHRRTCNADMAKANLNNRGSRLADGGDVPFRCTSKNEGKEKENSNIGIKCQFCEGTFKSRKGIAVHRRVCNSNSSRGKQPGRSTLHERRFNFSESRIKLLLARHRSRNEIITCHFCERKFYGKKGIAVHQRTCAADMAKANLNNRGSRLVDGGDIPFRCKPCGLSFSSRKCLTNHFNKTCRSTEGSLSPVVLANKIRMKYLKKSNASDPLKCLSCDKMFKSRKDLGVHFMKCVDEPLTLESSDGGTANNSFRELNRKNTSDGGTANKSLSELNRENTSDAGNTKLLYKCPHGKRRFKSKKGLGIHLRKCVEEFPCQSDSDFENVSTEPVKKLEMKVPSKKCPHCRRVFLSRNGLNMHLQNSCEDAVPDKNSLNKDPENKRYKCKLCRLTLGSRKLYVQHLKGHKTDCSIVLEDCNKTQHTGKSRKGTRLSTTSVGTHNMEQQPSEKQQNYIEDLVNKKIAKQLVNLWAPDEVFSRHHFHVKIPTALEQYENNGSLDEDPMSNNQRVTGYSHICPSNTISEYEDTPRLQVLDTKSFIGELLSCKSDELYEELCDRGSLYRCICGMYTRDQTMYNLHAATHAKDVKACSFCNFKADDWKDIYVHLSDHKK